MNFVIYAYRELSLAKRWATVRVLHKIAGLQRFLTTSALGAAFVVLASERGVAQ